MIGNTLQENLSEIPAFCVPQFFFNYFQISTWNYFRDALRYSPKDFSKISILNLFKHFCPEIALISIFFLLGNFLGILSENPPGFHLEISSRIPSRILPVFLCYFWKNFQKISGRTSEEKNAGGISEVLKKFLKKSLEKLLKQSLIDFPKISLKNI